MDTRLFFYPILRLDSERQLGNLLGTAFPVGPDGDLLTCRHVVDQVDASGKEILTAVWDREAGHGWPITRALFPSDSSLDLAYLPKALRREKKEVLPFVDPGAIVAGLEVYVYGYFAASGWAGNIRPGYFSGRVVSVENRHPVIGPLPSLTLPFAAVEGLSGSPVMTYYNGPKAVGVIARSESQRVLAYEVVDQREGESHYREAAHRIIEFGLAHHAQPVVDFLNELAAEGDLPAPIVSSGRVEVPGLE